MDQGVVIALAFVAPLALYAFVVGVFTDGIATWTVGVLRPLLLMLVFAPGIVVGHGVGIAPVAMVLGHDLLHPRPGSMLGTNLAIWLICAFLGFLFECALAFWWRRRRRRP